MHSTQKKPRRRTSHAPPGKFVRRGNAYAGDTAAHAPPRLRVLEPRTGRLPLHWLAAQTPTDGGGYFRLRLPCLRRRVRRSPRRPLNRRPRNTPDDEKRGRTHAGSGTARQSLIYSTLRILLTRLRTMPYRSGWRGCKYLSCGNVSPLKVRESDRNATLRGQLDDPVPVSRRDAARWPVADRCKDR